MVNPYPINLNLTGKPVAVVGGGRVAARKIKDLLLAGARVTVISPKLHPTIDRQAVSWLKRPYRTGDISKMHLVIACTNDETVNRQIVLEADSLQLVNNASDKTQSDFFNVAKIETPTFLVTVSTRGNSPTATRVLKRRLAAWLDEQK